MTSKSYAALAASITLCWAGSAGGMDPPTTLASTWHMDARAVVAVEVQRGTGLMRIRLGGKKLMWTADTEPYISQAVADGCAGATGPPSAALEIDLSGDPEHVAIMTDLVMDAFMSDFKVEVSIELAHCSPGNRYLIRDLRAR